MTHITDNHDGLLDYLYEEGDPGERLMIAKHLQECAACAVAVLEFQNVRGMLSDWTPPGAQLGFRVVRDPISEASLPAASPTSPSASDDHRARGGWSWGWGPTTTKAKSWWWGGMLQAAAAVVIFISGMAASQLHVEYRNGRLTVSTPSAVPAAVVRNTSIPLPPERGTPPNIHEIVRAVLAERGDASPSAADTERILQRMRAMIDQSEQRQQHELALRLSQVSREVDTQHKADVEQIRQDFGQQQEATIDYLVRTSGGVK